MTDDVKPRRAYRSTKRAEQVAQTRRDIIATAGVLFRDHGYAGVSMPAIATDAGVAVETIYRAFGSKAGLFSAVVDAAVAGGASRAEVPVVERPAIRAIVEEPDPRRQVELYAATQPGIHRRAGPLLRVLRDAAPTDPELGVALAVDRGQSALGSGRVRRDARRPRRAASRTVRRGGRDGLWALTSLAVFDMLVGASGWTVERYERWLADRLIDVLLD